VKIIGLSLWLTCGKNHRFISVGHMRYTPFVKTIGKKDAKVRKPISTTARFCCAARGRRRERPSPSWGGRDAASGGEEPQAEVEMAPP
jgi:hypothetical protein